MRSLIPFLVMALIFVPSTAGAQDSIDVERLERELAELRAEVEELRKAAMARVVEKVATEPVVTVERVEEIEHKLDVLAGEIERMQLGAIAPGTTETSPETSRHGLGIGASKVYNVDQGLSIGGYGEGLYENFDSTREDGSSAGKTDQFDFLRAILYVGYKFNDHWVLNTEIEIEHADEVFLEFATLDYLWKPQLNFRTGLVLMPMGLLNELHEPNLFLSAERPNVERTILPSTWRENGVGIFGDVGKFSYRSYVTTGLDASGFSSSGIRGGRQKGSKAKAEDFAWVGRLDYTGTPGLLIGSSMYVGDSGQGIRGPFGSPVDARTTIYDAHVDWRARGLRARGVWAKAEIDDAAKLNRALGLTGSSSVGETLEGFYLELGYDLLIGRVGQRSLIPFFRYESLDTQHTVPAGFLRDPSKNADILTLGLAYRPIDQLIFKLDFQDWSTAADTGVDQWNLSLGYLF